MLQEDEDQCVAAKDQEIEVLEEEDQSVATKDQVIKCGKNMKVKLLL